MSNARKTLSPSCAGAAHDAAALPCGYAETPHTEALSRSHAGTARNAAALPCGYAETSYAKTLPG
ncbi:MAG: hypothetical protein HFH51_03235 [Lachnospiraceae bacterium]|nr:hypothetical protein [Lachnospiraceae bacterium]